MKIWKNFFKNLFMGTTSIASFLRNSLKATIKHGGGSVVLWRCMSASGVGNLIFPLLEEEPNMFVHACDISPRAIRFVKNNPSFCSDKINAFECDITTEEITKKTHGSTIS